MAERGRFRAADAVLSHYRFHPDQLIKDQLKISRGRLRSLDKALVRLADRPRLARLIRKRIADRLLRLGKRLLKNGHRDEALRALTRARDLAPLAGLKASWILFRDARRKVTT
jgi:hypothetical protein